MHWNLCANVQGFKNTMVRLCVFYAHCAAYLDTGRVPIFKTCLFVATLEVLEVQHIPYEVKDLLVPTKGCCLFYGHKVGRQWS